MPKRLKRSLLNGFREDELPQSIKRRLALRTYKAANAMDNSEETRAYPIPLPFIDEINIFENKSIHSKSESNFDAENLFTVLKRTSSTIPFPDSPDKPSTSSAFAFPDSPDKPSTSSAFAFPDSPGTPEHVSVLTDSESTSASDTSEDELASVSSCQSIPGTPKTQAKKMTRSDYYRERLNQIEREQQDRRERWKKKLELMEKLLNK